MQSFLHHADVVSALAAQRAHIPHIGGIRVAEPKRFRHKVRRIACRKTERFVCVSNSVEQFASRTMKLPASKLTTISNAIDLSELKKIEQLDRQDFSVADAPLIVFAGRLHPQKGLLGFFSRIQDFFREVPNAQLLMVGDGELKAPLEKICRQEAVGDRVKFLGWREDALAIVATADLLMLPSRWEGMPNVVLEAMALSKPVVAFDVEGVRELIGDDSNQLVEENDYQALFASIGRMVGDAALCEKTGARNYARIESEFTLDRMIQAYEHLYTRVLSEI